MRAINLDKLIADLADSYLMQKHLAIIENQPIIEDVSEWIPISSHKYPEDRQLIWFTDNNGIVGMDKVIYGYNCLDGRVGGRKFNKNEIIAWKPILEPKPYTKKGKGR